jgi:ankyrin repeat protein
LESVTKGVTGKTLKIKLLIVNRLEAPVMKHILITTIAAVVLVGCGPSVGIQQASREGNIEAVKQHLASGTDVDAKNEYGGTPLHFAARGQKEVAELLIAKGANVNAMSAYRSTPLDWAIIRNRPEIVELLIANGADVNAKDAFGKTPLDSAIEKNHTELADLLRKHGGKTGEELKAVSR